MSRFLSATPALPVADLDRGIAFYQAHLGLELYHRDPGVAVMGLGAVGLHLWCASDTGWRERADLAARPVVSGAESFLAGTGSARLHVDDIETLYAAHLAAGIVHPNGPLADKPWGLREFAILDPDGNCLTFHAPLAGE